jgi:hypothetical protein
MSASQAERRGFDSHRPLHFFLDFIGFFVFLTPELASVQPPSAAFNRLHHSALSVSDLVLLKSIVSAKKPVTVKG